jgi:hypothetical protein
MEPKLELETLQTEKLSDSIYVQELKSKFKKNKNSIRARY